MRSPTRLKPTPLTLLLLAIASSSPAFYAASTRAQTSLIDCPPDATETDLTHLFEFGVGGIACPSDRSLGDGDACDDGSYRYDVYRTSIWGQAGDANAGFPFANTRWSEIWLNINGNISFGGPVSTYTPNAIPGLELPTIAVYFGDVDLTGSDNAGRILLCEDPARARIMFTWRDVGYFDARYPLERLNSFQMLLSNPDTVCDHPELGTIDGLGVEFRYAALHWYVGEASEGNQDGLCDPDTSVEEGGGCVPAVVGFDTGDGETAFAVEGTRTRQVNDNLLSGVGSGAVGPGHYRFLLLDGASMPSICGDGEPDLCIVCAADACDAPLYQTCDDGGAGSVFRVAVTNGTSNCHIVCEAGADGQSITCDPSPVCP